MTEYIIFGFKNDKEDPLGFFMVLPVEGDELQFYRLNFNNVSKIYWDRELLHYVVQVSDDDARLKKYYR